MARYIFMTRIALVVLGALLFMVSCNQSPAPGSGSVPQPTKSASIRPPKWIQGHWRCDSKSAPTACFRVLLGNSSQAAGSPIFTETEVRGELTLQTSIAWFPPAHPTTYNVTQTVTDSTYTIEEKADTQSRTHRWTRTDSGLDYEFQAVGFIQNRAAAPYVRWSGDSE